MLKCPSSAAGEHDPGRTRGPPLDRQERYEYLGHHRRGNDLRRLRLQGPDALGALAGVTDVYADPATGRVTVESCDTVDPDAVKNAVEAAGYRVIA